MHQKLIAKEAFFKPRYRSDIDGLRGIAVFIVVFFHLGFSWVRGGYVGVDVFFVISGYLLTGTIAKEIAEQRFSIISFYERRARRILPALFVTTFLTALTAILLFMPDELRDTGLSLIGVSSFLSNVLFWNQTDYFAAAVELKPFIHTWSLSVEEQFYIVIPILLSILMKNLGGKVGRTITALAVSSFALSLVLTTKSPSANYYLLPSRAWELLVGSVISLRLIPQIRSSAMANVISLLGIISVVGSALLLTPISPFPGYNALWPCVGSAAFIYANSNHATFAGRLISQKFPVLLGLVSYSLYLVHWPIIVFYRYQLLRDPEGFEIALTLIMMGCLATVMWRFVEQPFRNRDRVSNKFVLTGAVVGLLVTGAAGALFYIKDGFPKRFPGIAQKDKNEVINDAPQCFLEKEYAAWHSASCYLTPEHKQPILLWGDSHANHYRLALQSAASVQSPALLFYGSAGCLPVLGVKFNNREICQANNDNVLSIVKTFGVKSIVLSGYWYRSMQINNISFSDIIITVNRLRSAGLRVSIIGDNPDFTFANSKALEYRLKLAGNRSQYYMPVRNDMNINSRLKELVGVNNFFDPMVVLCRKDKCLAYKDGHALMSDNAHFAAFGSGLVVKRLWPFLEQRRR